MINEPLIKFITALKHSLENDGFISIVLAGYEGDIADLKKIIIRPITIKKQNHLSFTYRYKTRDIVKNFLFDAAVNEIEKSLTHGFESASLCTIDFDMAYPSCKQSKPTQNKSDDLSHDRKKNRMIKTSGKKYLSDLKITDLSGNILKSSHDKFRQIDKYIEILAGLIKGINPSDIKRIVDMGSGKGYLTFALYDYLQENMGITPNVVGVEYRKDMVDLCNQISKNSNFQNLSFVQGSINDFDADGADILIALHACDTATDDAIIKGVQAGAKLIVVAPCCHKQIRKEIEKNNVLNDVEFITRHGIFMERQAEMVTDSMRAMMLEYCGYDVKVFEFISGEHTAKNIMIVASKKIISDNDKSKIKIKLNKIKKDFGINHHALEKIMDDDLSGK